MFASSFCFFTAVFGVHKTLGYMRVHSKNMLQYKMIPRSRATSEFCSHRNRGGNRLVASMLNLRRNDFFIRCDIGDWRSHWETPRDSSRKPEILVSRANQYVTLLSLMACVNTYRVLVLQNRFVYSTKFAAKTGHLLVLNSVAMYAYAEKINGDLNPTKQESLIKN